MLTPIEKKQLANYEKQAAMPKWKFIILYGMLAWGIPVALLVTAISMLINKTPVGEVLRKDLWFNLLGFPIGGIFFGLYMRNFIPRQIRRLKAKENNPEI